MNHSAAKKLVEKGLIPLHASPGGENRFTLADAREIIDRADAAEFFVVGVNGCLLFPNGGIMEPLEMIFDGSRDLNWMNKRQEVNAGARRFINTLTELGAHGASVNIVAPR